MKPLPRDRRAGQLGRQRLGDVETAAELLLEPRSERIEAVGIVDDDELRGRPLDPAAQVADLVQRDALEVGIGAGVLGDRGDVEVVVDVAVEREALSLDGRIAGGLIRAVGYGATRPWWVDGGALVADSGASGRIGVEGTDRSGRSR